MSATALHRLHFWLCIQWALHIPVTLALYVWWRSQWEAGSILYLAEVSIYANFVTHWGALGAARVEVLQTPDD